MSAKGVGYGGDVGGGDTIRLPTEEGKETKKKRGPPHHHRRTLRYAFYNPKGPLPPSPLSAAS